MYDLQYVILLAAIAFSFSVWWRARGAAQVAIYHTRKYCSDRGVQLLDHCVALRKMKLTRDKANNIRLLRVYDFEFATTGKVRYKGTTQMLGRQIKSIDLEPFEEDPEHTYSHDNEVSPCCSPRSSCSTKSCN